MTPIDKAIEVVCLAALMMRLANPLFRDEICEDFEKAKPQ